MKVSEISDFFRVEKGFVQQLRPLIIRDSEVRELLVDHLRESNWFQTILPKKKEFNSCYSKALLREIHTDLSR